MPDLYPLLQNTGAVSPALFRTINAHPVFRRLRLHLVYASPPDPMWGTYRLVQESSPGGGVSLIGGDVAPGQLLAALDGDIGEYIRGLRAATHAKLAQFYTLNGWVQEPGGGPWGPPG